jgi:hypothetical protein
MSAVNTLYLKTTTNFRSTLYGPGVYTNNFKKFPDLVYYTEISNPTSICTTFPAK